jgi:hypothetical protein
MLFIYDDAELYPQLAPAFSEACSEHALALVYDQRMMLAHLGAVLTFAAAVSGR